MERNSACKEKKTNNSKCSAQFTSFKVCISCYCTVLKFTVCRKLRILNKYASIIESEPFV